MHTSLNDRSQNSPRKKIIQLLGFSIWCPSLAISVGGVWGVQIVLIASLFYLFSIIIFKRAQRGNNNFIGILGVLFLSMLLILSAVGGVLPLSRGILSVLSEFTVLVVTYAVYHSLLKEYFGARYFMEGFYFGAILSALIAITQFMGLNLGIEQFAWEMSNPSFTLFTTDAAMKHQRAYAFTPEPSILSGLFLTIIAIQSIRAKYFGTHKEWLLLGLFVLAMGTTASQGLLFLPIAIFSGFCCINSENKLSRKKALSWLYLGLFVAITVISFLLIESLQRNFVLRMIEIFVDTGEKTSYGSRSESIIASFRMFSESPILGAGPGASTDLLERYAQTDDEIGAASAFIRYLAELGVFYICIWVFLFFSLIYWGLKEKSKNNLLRAEFVAMGFWFCISATFFVGYRTLYQNIIWLGIALALFQTTPFRKKKATAFFLENE